MQERKRDVELLQKRLVEYSLRSYLKVSIHAFSPSLSRIE